MANLGERIIVLIDMDCFFCQVETRLQPELKGKPLGVVQYNHFQTGKIIAATYEAREQGIVKHMFGEEAKQKCPELILVSVPTVRGKADYSRYRKGGREVIKVLKEHSTVVERASVDEAYMDITDIVEQQMSMFHMPPKEVIQSLATTFIVGYSEVGKNDEEQRSEGVNSWVTTALGELGDIQSQKLAIAGILVEKMRADVFEKTGFRCSAGISYNKILAKLACGLHKPNRQTILPAAGVPSLFLTLPVKKVRNLGGKVGDELVKSLGCKVMADLLPYTLQDLQARFDEKTGLRLYNIARGIDDEPVTTRLTSKSVGNCKQFPGNQAIVSKEVLEYWMGCLATEVAERLEEEVEENERRATLLTVSFQTYQNKKTVSQSRSCSLTSYKAERIAKQSMDMITMATKHPIAQVGLSAGKFVPAKGSGSFMNFFKVKNQTDSDTSVRLEAICEPSTSKASDFINSRSSFHSSDCTKSTFDHELIERMSQTNKSEDESTDLSARSYQPSNKYKEVKENTLFRGRQNSPNRDLNTKGISDEPELKIEVANHRYITSDPAPLSPLTNMNNALHPDNFKKSFFMNAFNKSDRNNDESDLFEGKTEIAKDMVKTTQQSTIHTKHESDAQCSRLTDIHRENKLHLISYGEKSLKDISKRTDIRFSDETASNESLIENNETQNKDESHSKTDICNDSVDNELNETDENQSTLVELQEIFPDLNNIDQTIVALLPPKLQREANLLLRAQKENTTASTEIPVKSQKPNMNNTKPSNSKSVVSTSTNKINHFFKKPNQIDTNYIGPMEMCLQCNKLIPLKNYLEHVDFHMAQSVQKEINNSPTDDRIVTKSKRTVTDSDMKAQKRKGIKCEIPTAEKKFKSIASFFS